MIILTATEIRKAFGLNEVLCGASLTLQTGRCMGLVGANGCGKSTFLRILAEREHQDGGTISIAKGVKLGYLAQQAEIEPGLTVWGVLEKVFEPVFEMEARMRRLEEEMAEKHEDAEAFDRLGRQYAALTDAFEEAGGYAWRSSVSGVLAGLAFPRAQWEQDASLLSGGEQTRLCLGRMLLQKPDLLMLDEPTNHLDLASLQWLEEYLKAYKGAIIIVSHDRYFLDAVCTDIAEMFLGRIEQYEGNYTRYQRLRTERFEARQRAFDAQQKEIAHQQAVIDRLKSFNREKSLKRARSREKVLDKMELLERPQEEKQVRFSFDARRRTGDDVLIIQDLAKGYDGRTLFQHFDLHLRAGDRAVLIGPNGVGKSTLLRLIVKEQKADDGTIRYGANVDIGYYDQQQTGLHPEKTVLDELWDRFPQMEQSDLRSVLGCFLFTGDDVFQPIHTLSGGEKGRVALTRLMLEKDNFLLLDEPTNHLDMDSREVLEGALDDFPGTILAVSHDRYFINRIATRIIEMRPDGVSFYLGNYDDYLEKKRREAEGIEERAPGVTRTALEKEKKRDRQAREADKQEKARIAAIEKEIADLEQRVADLEAQSALPEVYSNPERAKENALSLRQTRETLEAKYDLWAELSEA